MARLLQQKSEKLKERLKEELKCRRSRFQTSEEVAVECLDGFIKDKQFSSGGGNRRTAIITSFTKTKVLNIVGKLLEDSGLMFDNVKSCHWRGGRVVDRATLER